MMRVALAAKLLLAYTDIMSVDVKNVVKLKVPLSVLLAEKPMNVQDILNLAPGSVIQFTKHYEGPLQLLANGQIIGSGVAVKVNEKFGLQVKDMGRPEETIKSLGS